MFPNTVTTVRVPLFVVLLICVATAVASAKPRHVAVLDFDGPKALAENSRRSVLAALKDYDLVAPARWESELAKAKQTNVGPTSWTKASEKAGVEAVVEGGFQTLGARKFLVLSVVDATTGHVIDGPLQIDIKGSGLAADGELRLAEGLASRLEFLPEPVEVKPVYPPTKRLKEPVGSKSDQRAKAKAEVEQSAPVTSPAQVPAAPSSPKSTTIDILEGAPPSAQTTDTKTGDNTDGQADGKTAPPPKVAVLEQTCNDALGDCPALNKQLTQAPPPGPTWATPRARISAGPYLGGRSLTFNADGIDNITQYTGVDSKGFVLSGEFYPFPLQKTNGQPSGFGVTLQIYKSLGTTVGIDDDDTTGDYTFNQNGFLLAAHWRQPIGMVTIDGEVGYSQDDYTIEDPPEGFEVPDTAYRAMHAGVHLDMQITERGSVGFGGRYFYVLGQGDLTSTEFYGPGESSGFSVDAHFIAPLPAGLFLRGELEYKRVTTDFSGGGVITDEEDVFDSTDSWINASLQLGIQF